MPRKTADTALDTPAHKPASMRPRPDATENLPESSRPSSAAACFNEAAARCHGKQESEPSSWSRR